MITDALQRPITIGNAYGVAISDNGHSRVYTGIALRFTPTGKVTLHVATCAKALYDNPLQPVAEFNSTITCKASQLFPINA